MCHTDQNKLSVMTYEDGGCSRECNAARGEIQKSVIGHFCLIEKKMASIESKERNTGKTNKVLRLLSSSGEKQNVEQLKSIRKQHGAQSKEYKEALTKI